MVCSCGPRRHQIYTRAASQWLLALSDLSTLECAQGVGWGEEVACTLVAVHFLGDWGLGDPELLGVEGRRYHIWFAIGAFGTVWTSTTIRCFGVKHLKVFIHELGVRLEDFGTSRPEMSRWLLWRTSWVKSTLRGLTSMICLSHIAWRRCLENHSSVNITMMLAVIKLLYVSCRVSIFRQSKMIVFRHCCAATRPIFNRLDQAFSQCLETFSLVDQDLWTLLTLSTDVRLRTTLWSTMPSLNLTILRSFIVEISHPDNHLILHAHGPFTRLSLQKVMLTDQTASISQRWGLRSASHTISSSKAMPFIASIWAILLALILIDRLFIPAVVPRVQLLALLKWQQVQCRILLLSDCTSEQSPLSITTTAALTIVPTAATATLVTFDRSTVWVVARSRVLASWIFTSCLFKCVERHWI